MQLIILWIGLVGDIVTKGSLTFQLIRLAIRHTWVNFGVVLGAYVISSFFVRTPPPVHKICCTWCVQNMSWHHS